MLISSGRVTGQFVVGVADGPDLDDEPDIIPAQGTVTFSATVPYVPLPGSFPPVTVMTSSIVGVLDGEGFLCTPDPLHPAGVGVRGLRLFANDDPAAPVKDWTWTVTYRFAVVNGVTPTIPSHSLALLTGAEVDLTTVVKVPSSPGVGVDQVFALLAQAEAAASTAAAVAQGVRDDANAGSFDGEDGTPGTPGTPGAPGAPGNATIRISNTAGKAAYLWDTAAARDQLIYGDTGRRNISTLLTAGSSAGVEVRRLGSTVFFASGDYQPGTIGVVDEFATGLPAGFRPAGGVEVLAWTTGAGGSRRINMSGSRVRIYNAASPTETIVWAATWHTTDPWPTALPGTPVGTIPNL